MKTKELICLLQQEDPSGEVEVCVGNVDIHFLEYLPAYYDGRLQVLKRDEKDNIIGGKYIKTGHKVNIHTLSISDAVYNYENFEVDYSDLHPESAERAKTNHEALRQWRKNLEKTIELEYFLEWAKKKAEEITPDTEGIKELAEEFFKKNLSRDDEIKISLGKNYVETRKEQWDKNIKVAVEEGFLKLTQL